MTATGTGPTISATESLVGALLVAVVLAVLHLVAPRIRRLPLVPESATGSFAGGLAVAYVFLHLLPEIAAGNEAVGAALSQTLRPTPLVDLGIWGSGDLGIFLVALAGFTAFYGLERLAQRTAEATDDVQAEPPTGRQAWVYRLHLGSFLIYNALITYTMPLRLRTGLAFAVLFTVAMGLHFVLTDRGLEEHYGERFRSSGRPALAAGLLVGWLVAALVSPSSTLTVALLTALLGGSILLNVFKEELPSGRRSSFPWFLSGLVVYALLLSAVTALGD